VAHYLKLDRKELHARVIMAQGRQNTNYAINLYACHPFFIQGYATMTNGRMHGLYPHPGVPAVAQFSRLYGLPERFGGVHPYPALHPNPAGLDISAYKHIITPLQDDAIAEHPDADLLKGSSSTPAAA
jgi:hypothetical protein